MAKRNQPERWVSSMLAAGMAVAGTLFFFDRLPSFMQNNVLSAQAILHSAPMLLVLVGVALIVVDSDSSNGHEPPVDPQESKVRRSV